MSALEDVPVPVVAVHLTQADWNFLSGTVVEHARHEIFRCVSKTELATHDPGVFQGPAIVAYGGPFVVEEHFHTAFESIWSTDETNW